MKHQLIVLLASITLAWTDVSHLGHNYNAPSGSYLPGDHSSSSTSGGAQLISSVIVQEPSGSYLPGGGDGYFGSSSFGTHRFGGHGGGGHDAEETEIHYYGDENHEQSHLRIHVAPAPSRNRVLFVKSPDTGSSIIPEIVAPSGQSQERTVVYVLSKQQGGIGAINIPASVTHNVLRSKPEVFYLKYKDAQDAQRVVADSLHGEGSGVGVSSLDNRESFVKTLGSGVQGGISGVLGSFSGATGGAGGISIGTGSSLGGESVGAGGVSFSSSGGSGINLGGAGGGIGLVGSGSSGSAYGVPGASGPY